VAIGGPFVGQSRLAIAGAKFLAWLTLAAAMSVTALHRFILQSILYHDECDCHFKSPRDAFSGG
jgi:hypothetical protein